MHITRSTGCPCGSQHTFDNCCKLIISAEHTANTAEQLMRSRYSAFKTGHIDYLIRSLAPISRTTEDRQQLTQTVSDLSWQSLRIIRTEKGQPNDTEGMVEFAAYYLQNGKPYTLHEQSQFIKQQGHWYYLTGKILATSFKKPGRNELCWCGSDKKFKHCHN